MHVWFEGKSQGNFPCKQHRQKEQPEENTPGL